VIYRIIFHAGFQVWRVLVGGQAIAWRCKQAEAAAFARRHAAKENERWVIVQHAAKGGAETVTEASDWVKKNMAGYA
jgi:hypothetical protein